jgi:fructokinase
MSKPRYGLIEAGGTKFVLGVATGPDDIIATHRIDTTTPDETIGAAVEWLAKHGPFSAIGIASFGPLQLDKAAPDYGCVTQTPKPHWSRADLVAPFARAFDCPIALDTDVNGAALAEVQWGAAKGAQSALYFTIGTGVGGGAVIDGRILHGQSHPEMGHMRVARHPADLEYKGHCPFHGDCLEGLAAGPSIIDRWGASLSDLPDDHIGHDIIAHYLASMTVTCQALFEPEKIILGGGVMATPGLLPRVVAAADTMGGGYFVSRAADIVTHPGLGTHAGLLGALALAQAMESATA